MRLEGFRRSEGIETAELKLFIHFLYVLMISLNDPGLSYYTPRFLEGLGNFPLPELSFPLMPLNPNSDLGSWRVRKRAGSSHGLGVRDRALEGV